MQAHVEWSDDRGEISFSWGRCTLRAESGVLTLRAEAPDEDNLRQIQQRVADRLELFARREELTVTWTPLQGTGEPMRQPPDATEEATRG
jgi:cytochrome b561